MLATWLTRLTIPALAVCGLTLLPGCHDDECADCGNHCTSCAEDVSTTTVSENAPLVNTAPVATAPVNAQGPTQYETSYRPESTSDVGGHRDTMELRQRLATIERERILYPERATRLDQEANQIRAQLEVSERNSPVSNRFTPEPMSYRPEVAAPSSNISVTNRNYIDGTTLTPPNTNNYEARRGSNSDQRIPDAIRNNYSTQENSTQTAITIPDIQCEGQETQFVPENRQMRENRIFPENRQVQENREFNEKQERRAINTKATESERSIPDVNQSELQEPRAVQKNNEIQQTRELPQKEEKPGSINVSAERSEQDIPDVNQEELRSVK